MPCDDGHAEAQHTLKSCPMECGCLPPQIASNIVIDLNVVRAQAREIGKLEARHRLNRRAQALRPGFNRAERGFGPVHRAHELPSRRHRSASLRRVPSIDRRRHRGRVLHLYRSPRGRLYSALISHKVVLDSNSPALSVSLTQTALACELSCESGPNHAVSTVWDAMPVCAS